MKVLVGPESRNRDEREHLNNSIMLTKENAKLWWPQSSYPTFRYESKKGIRVSLNGLEHPEWEKEGYKKVTVFKNEDEDFANYCNIIKDEHAGISDQRMLECPHGIFNGRKRNARWMEEILRRNLK